MRVGASKQVAVFLQDERRVEFGGSSNDQLCSRSCSVQRGARSHGCERLSRTAMRAENIIGCDTATAKTAIDSCDLNSLAAEHWGRHSETDESFHQPVEMIGELVAQIARGA